MFKRLKSIFKTKDEKQLAQATEHFDELMERVDEDQKDLSKLEHDMRKEWDEIDGDIEKLGKGVDDVVNNNAG